MSLLSGLGREARGLLARGGHGVCKGQSSLSPWSEPLGRAIGLTHCCCSGDRRWGPSGPIPATSWSPVHSAGPRQRL